MASDARAVGAEANVPASSSASARPAADNTEAAPTQQELQFARATYIILAMWPAMRQAVLEMWGGPESEEKRDFLLSHLCDEYGTGKGKLPDVDDLADLLENYLAEEYDCQLEDDSAALVALHVCNSYKAVFEEQHGTEFLKQLEEAFAKVSKSSVKNQTRELAEDDEAEDEDVSDAPATTRSAPRATAPRPEPEIDEDGFETVVSRRRR
ncbi:rRNA accumulation- protein [Malassezia brasiliensis]|uniref:rRNA accumulation- protein n=1 Tax=Malassezia brasiliensis TaxID=1821822 RepID=A0AAF0DQU6_9BASI|nr:rRNA accumulation- protein [Malassezia brasiliensis]